jgi:hypothetical protein
MPDNRQDGEIEDFLLSMVDPGLPLLSFAKSSTSNAKKKHGAMFSESDQSKAVLACWLAWQEEPAQRYGEAMQAGKFDRSTPASTAFVKWIRRLYGL